MARSILQGAAARAGATEHNNKGGRPNIINNNNNNKGNNLSLLPLLAFLALLACFVSSVQSASLATAAAAEHALDKQDVEKQLEKRSIPISARASYNQHNIMRFGRAPHNIMHFGKRSGESGGDVEGAAAAVVSVPDDYFEGQHEQLSGPALARLLGVGSAGPRYVLVPIDLYPQQQAQQLLQQQQQQQQPRFEKKSRGGRAMFPEDRDNLYMHFG